MKITVAGQDRSSDLGQAMSAEAARLQAAGGIGALAPDHTALRLKVADPRQDYLGKFIDLLRIRHGIRTTDYYIPRGPGLRGKVAVALKTFLWKLLRYQHDRITYQQNTVNELTINALEFQQARIAELERRLARLEKPAAGEPAP